MRAGAGPRPEGRPNDTGRSGGRNGGCIGCAQAGISEWFDTRSRRGKGCPAPDCSPVLEEIEKSTRAVVRGAREFSASQVKGSQTVVTSRRHVGARSHEEARYLKTALLDTLV